MPVYVVRPRSKPSHLIFDKLLKIFIIPDDWLQEFDGGCSSRVNLSIPEEIAKECLDVLIE